jgi:hypothetical protein
MMGIRILLLAALAATGLLVAVSLGDIVRYMKMRSM